MDETPEQKYKRISEAIQQTILRNYPNPERRGCPGSAVVREVAGRRELIEDDNWQHITHCSPCYAEFLNYKEEWRRHRRRWRDPQVLGAGFAAVVAVFAGTYYLMHRQAAPRGPVQVTQLEYRPAVLNLRNVSSNRGGNNATASPEVSGLRRDRLDLTIILPFASEAGAYDIQFQDSERRTLISTLGRASINHGDTLVEVKWDLTKYHAGRYLVAWRQSPFGWTWAEVILK